MKLKTLPLALAAATALACAVGIAAAQQTPSPSSPPTDYHTNPTPEEMTQTKALNEKQSEQRGVTATGEPATAVDAHYQDVQQKYQQALHANEEQHRLYEQQMEEYERKYGHPGSYLPPAKN